MTDGSIEVNLIKILTIFFILLYVFLPAKYQFIGSLMYIIKRQIIILLRKLYIRKNSSYK